MPLSLKILSFKGQAYPQGEETLFDDAGGTIGRADANTLILADDEKIISRRHAAISLENDQYRLVDSSLAGTFIDDAVEPINNSSVQLTDGMQVRIGDYVISVSISEQQISPAEDSNPENMGSPFEPLGNPFAESENNIAGTTDDLVSIPEDDFNNPLLAEGEMPDNFAEDLLASVEEPAGLDLLDGSQQNSLIDQEFAPLEDAGVTQDNSLLESSVYEMEQTDDGLMKENISSLNDSYIPPEPIQSPAPSEADVIPDDFNFEDLFNDDVEEQPVTSERVEPVKIQENTDLLASSLEADEKQVGAPKPSPQARTIKPNPDKASAPESFSNHQLMQAFLTGAQMDSKGIDQTRPDETMSRLGAMFRQFVESTVAVLRNRAEFKSLFRVTVTTIKTSDNNPLKFAVTTDEAVKHLLNDGQGGFKPSIDSIDEGFNDLLNHQLAMQAGIQGSLNEILRQFDPAMIEKQYDEGLVLQKKTKCWEKYNQIYDQLKETAVDDFFGDAFSEAYEQQMKQLKKK